MKTNITTAKYKDVQKVYSSHAINALRYKLSAAQAAIEE